MLMIPRVAAVNDLSGLGKCSLTAAIPVLSAMGVQACPVPTAILTNQTGFSSYEMTDYTDHLDAYTEQWQRCDLHLNGIYTGFLANERQVEKILRLIEAFRRPETLLLVDPVMGDAGEVYETYTREMCFQMRCLAEEADVITPNLTEACLLAERTYASLVAHEEEDSYPERVAELAGELSRDTGRRVVVTGVRHQTWIYNIAVEDSRWFFERSLAFGGHYSGTGDLFSAVVCGGMVRGDAFEDTVRLATHFLENAIQDTPPWDPNEGVAFEKQLPMLWREMI